MNRFARVTLVASALSLTLTGCGSFDTSGFDPTDIFSSDMFNTKKKLQGDRRAVFPGGDTGRVAGRAAGAGQGLSTYDRAGAGCGPAGGAEAETQAQAEDGREAGAPAA